MMSTPRKGLPRASMTPSRIPTSATSVRATSPHRTAMTPAKKVFTSSNSDANDQGEEGIIVAIRMRPLNPRESSEKRVWRVLPQFSSVTQTTPSGQPLPERIMNRTFFTFDKTFGEEITTREVYDGVAKGIIDSVVDGLNGTIFAYGQTSSGKTYTMQGSGSIQDGSATGHGGIVHMAAQDIFSHIARTRDRVFLVRASFVEIYNEEVRDLLDSNNILQVREDPRRGVFVDSVEEIATDFSGLLQILFSGEKNRAFAATGMNERSSRSHTIFRVTIESRKKTQEIENSPEAANGVENDDGAVLISTLNLVDLAGSESVRHTGNTGDRLKEGAKINLSLLTLSRVIVGLGQPNPGHINFRDSKLTRILQPSLSGNARMAVVCCATPSELYLEETRSTLMFASRAKLVKTNAKVNEVLDDRSLIRKLQRELAEARKHSTGTGHSERLRALETEAANAGKARREAQEKLRRLQDSILNSAAIFDTARDASETTEPTRSGPRKRRLSDGELHLKTFFETPAKLSRIPTPKSAPEGNPSDKEFLPTELSPKTEIDLVRQAIAAKAAQKRLLEESVSEKSRIIQANASDLQRIEREKQDLITNLDSTKANRDDLQKRVQELESALAEKDSSFSDLQGECQGMLESKNASDERLNELQIEFDAWKRHSKAAIERLEEENRIFQDSLQDLETAKTALQQDFDRRLDDIVKDGEEKLRSSSDLIKELNETISSLRDEYTLQLQSMEAANSSHEEALQERDEELVELRALLSELRVTLEERDNRLQTLASETVELQRFLDVSRGSNNELQDRLSSAEGEKEAFSAELSDLKSSISDYEKKIEMVAMNAMTTEEEKQVLIQELQAKEERLSEMCSEIQELKETVSSMKSQTEILTGELAQTKSALEKERDERCSAEKMLTDEADRLRDSLQDVTEKREIIEADLTTAKESIAKLSNEKDQLQACMDYLHASNDSTTKMMTELNDDLNRRISKLTEDRDCAHEAREKADEQVTELKEEKESLVKELEISNADLAVAEGEVKTLESRIMVLRADYQLECSKSEEERTELIAERDSIKQELDNIKLALSETYELKSEAQEQLYLSRSEIERKDKFITSLEKGSVELKERITDLESQVEMLEKAKRNIEISYCDSQTKIALLEQTIAAKKQSMDETKERIKDLQQQLEELALASEQLQKRHEESEQQLGKCHQELEKTNVSLGSALEEKDDLLLKISALESRNENADSLSNKANEELRSCISILEEEKIELIQLLSSANESVRESRQAAFLSENKLSGSEHILQETMARLKVCENELNARMEQVRDLENKFLLLENSRSSDEMLERLEILAQEKQSIEEELSKERSDRTAWEEDHKRRMGEEQRLLIQEAERAMSLIRTERDQLKSTLSQSETDVYTVKQENEELLDETKRLEAKVVEAQRAISSLEAELNQLKSSKFDLNIENKDLREKLKAVAQERCFNERKTSEEVVKLTAELNRVKADLFEARQSGMEMDRDFSNLEMQREKYLDEIEMERARRLELEKRLPDMEAEVQRLNLFKQAQTIRNKENEMNVEVVKSLRLKLMEMEKEMKIKDSRIKKLESVRLTKEQVDALKKLKAERSQFQEENEKYKKRISQMEKDLDTMQAELCSSKGEDLAPNQTVAALRFEKTALETKLRKYLAYCKALENDKTQIVDALRSRKRDVMDDDFAGAVVSLCDQLTSLEEECDALSHAEGRASSYLVELERLRENMSSLQKVMDENQEKVLRLTRSEAELTVRLQRADQKNASLREELDTYRTRNGATTGKAEAEKSRQVKYLEQENLQLMLDLKAAKKQLQTARAKLDVLQMKALDDDTGDFSNIVPSKSDASSRHSAMSSSATNNPASPEEKENSPPAVDDGNKKGILGSAKKRRMSRAKRGLAQRNIGLGEGGAIDEENTGECKQS